MQATGQKFVDTLKSGASVVVELDFKESMAHPDDRCVWQVYNDMPVNSDLTNTRGCRQACDQ